MSAEGAKIFDIFVKTAIFYYDIWQRFIFEDLFLVITIKIRPKLGNLAQIRPETKSPDLTVFASLLISKIIIFLYYYYESNSKVG